MTIDEHRAVRSVVDAAYLAPQAEVVIDAGTVVALPVAQWRAAATESDHRLFVRRCRGLTLDIGCGPGRLTHALHRRRVPALGVDVSPEAVRQARGRGAPALCRDVFGAVPGAGTWQHALLADGNIGIGGDPARLLRRVLELLHPAGTVLAEIESVAVETRVHDVRLRVEGRVSAPFRWARVGVRGVADVARDAGMRVVGLHEHDGRHVAELARAR